MGAVKDGLKSVLKKLNPVEALKTIIMYLLLPATIITILLLIVPDRIACIPVPFSDTPLCLKTRDTGTVAFFPGYEIRDWLRDGAFVGLHAHNLDELITIAREHSDAADVLILSSGVTAELAARSSTDLKNYDCRLRRGDRKNGSEFYGALLVINRECVPLYKDLTKKPNLNKDRLELLRSYWSRPDQKEKLLDALVLRDPHSLSGYYVPLKKLGIASHPKSARLNCVPYRSSEDVVTLMTSTKCTILALGSDEWKDATDASPVDLGTAVEVKLDENLPRGPTCIRKGRFDGWLRKTRNLSPLIRDTLDSEKIDFRTFESAYEEYVRPVEPVKERMACIPYTASSLRDARETAAHIASRKPGSAKSSAQQ